MSGDFDSSFDTSFDVSAELPFFDYVAHALSRLPHMYRSGNPATPTNTEKAMAARLAPANALGAAMRAVLTQRNIDTAIGAQLDVLGDLVGRKRNGITDDEVYRSLCRAQILTNKSNGTRRDKLAVARAVVPGATAVRVITMGGAASIFDVQGVTLESWRADVLAELLGQATSAGVRTIIVYTTGPIANQARWGTGTWGSKGNASRARNTEQ